MIAIQAYLLQQSHRYGAISALAKEYKVCRQFVYTLLSTLQLMIPHLFSPVTHAVSITKKEILTAILSYRLEGGASIEAISTLMERFEQGYSSVGYISQSLSSMGKLLPNTLKIEANEQQLIVFASDEIFSKSKPILITVEPKSSAILKIELAEDRSGERWAEHFNTIEVNGFKAITMTSDGGLGLQSGKKKTLADATWQPDTYHAVAHRLGIWVSRFQESAYGAIAYEYSRQAVIASATTELVIGKRVNAYEAALTETSKAIELYENFSFLYHCIIHSLKAFHSNGVLRERKVSQGDIEAALVLMESLNHKHVTKEVNTIKTLLPNLLNYFEQTKTSLKKCQSFDIQAEALQALCAAWQWDKALIKAKVFYRRAHAREQKTLSLQKAKLLLQEQYNKLKEKVFNELDNIIQASSIVEGINSILRPYLDRSKNQVTQEFLNLFMFYHNHRRYRAGKRKGKTPMEILLKHKQDKDWIELLTDAIEKVEPAFFL